MAFEVDAFPWIGFVPHHSGDDLLFLTLTTNGIRKNTMPPGNESLKKIATMVSIQTVSRYGMVGCTKTAFSMETEKCISL